MTIGVIVSPTGSPAAASGGLKFDAAGNLLVATSDAAAGPITYAEIDNLSNSRQKVTPPPNCVAVEAWYLDPAGNSTGRMLRIVLDAASDADANAKLALAGARAFVPKGQGFRETRTGLPYIQRVDLQTDVAETNTNKVFFVFRSIP